MKKVFDLIEAINESVAMFLDANGRKPDEVSISRVGYRRLLEIRADDGMIGNLVIGCAPIVEIETEAGRIRLSIDEMVSETTIVLT
jgi:hypothetical protein